MRKDPEYSHTVVEHLQMVQAVIIRMAGNSNDLKAAALMVSFMTCVMVVLSDNPHWLMTLGGCLPIVVFWTLDARYLRLERAYVKLHIDILKPNSTIKRFDLNPRTYLVMVDSVWKTAWSWSVCHFYISTLLLASLVSAATLAP